MAGIHKLSAAKVDKLKEPGRYGDGAGLWLQVSQWGTKAWIFRYMLDGKARQMGLGPIHTIGLADAREKARQARMLLLDGLTYDAGNMLEHSRRVVDAATADLDASGSASTRPHEIAGRTVFAARTVCRGGIRVSSLLSTDCGDHKKNGFPLNLLRTVRVPMQYGQSGPRDTRGKPS